MKKKTRGLSLLIGSSLLAGAITGCGGSGMTATETTTTTTTTTTYYEATESSDYSVETSPEVFSADASPSSSAKSGGKYSSSSKTETTSSDYWNNPAAGNGNESYTKLEENGFCLVQTQPLSTFAADVDTASYSNVRRMIQDGYSVYDINADAVRPEEFINYFDYDLNTPDDGEKFGITTEVAVCPWNTDNQLMFVGMTTAELDMREAPVSNLVFLIDVSGSMNSENKLPLLKKSMNELVDALPNEVTISIVTYSGKEKVVLSGESMRSKKKIKREINKLSANGSTNGQAGMQMAYEIALENYVEGGNNRVIMCTDGDLNVGISSLEDLENFITEKKDSGVFLSVLGFGNGNYKDDKMEKLADCGNGNYSYIDSLSEGKKVLVDEMSSTLYTVAKDVKLQVEFNPENVSAYRLIGYENRVMADVDFNDDKKDGGEIGAGHQVVALYEIIPTGSAKAINLKYQSGEQKQEGDYSDEFATVSVRYKEPESDKSQLFSVVVDTESLTDNPSEDFRFASSVAEFALILTDSDNKGTANFDDILDTYEELENTDEYKDEFYSLVETLEERG